VFFAECAAELIGLGKCWVLTDSTPDRPVSVIINRENVRDWAYSTAGDLEFVIYDSERESINESTFERKTINQRILWTKKEKIVFEQNGKDEWTRNNVLSTVNNLGYIPMRDAWMGREAWSVIDVPSKLQVNMLNLDSELRSIIRKQALTILTMPREARDQVEILSSQTVLFIDKDSYQPQWVAYPAQSLDAHFEYSKSLTQRIIDIGNESKSNSMIAESGISKAWSFLDVETVLNMASNALDGLFKQILFDWASWRDADKSIINFGLVRDFDVKDLKEDLEIALKAFTLNLGKTAHTDIRKQIRDRFNLELTQDMQDKSDEEIELLENVVEPSLFNLDEIQGEQT